MRLEVVRSSVWFIFSRVLPFGLLASVAIAQIPGGPPDPPRNLSVLNKPFKPMGTDRGSWVWRDRKIQPPGDGFEGIVAHVTERKVQGGGSNPDQATLRVWLYDAVDHPTAANTAKLQLSEKYIVHLTELNETNSASKGNRSFHFMVSTSIKDADGADNQERPGTRTFLITGTRERGQNGSRTLRITTFTSTPVPAVLPAPAPDAESTPPPGVELMFDSRSVFYAVGCSDYPDDAVLEEEQYSTSEPVPTEEPNPDDTWMTYSWPVP